MAELIDKGALVALIEKDKRTAGETTWAQGYWCGLADAQDHAHELPTTTEADIRAKAIEEFAERLLKKSETIPVKIGNRCIQAVEETFLEKRIKAIAEQLKGE